jgi:hypothetical protein
VAGSPPFNKKYTVTNKLYVVFQRTPIPSFEILKFSQQIF